MSALSGHAQAYRVLADAFDEEWSRTAEGVPGKDMLLLLGMVHRNASNRLEAIIRDQAGKATGDATG